MVLNILLFFWGRSRGDCFSDIFDDFRVFVSRLLMVIVDDLLNKDIRVDFFNICLEFLKIILIFALLICGICFLIHASIFL